MTPRSPLLLLQLLAVAATTLAQEPDRRFAAPAPPSDPALQRHELAVFRSADTPPPSCLPGQCLNGGRCHRRVRVCECPLGFNGTRCERTDTELFARVEAAEAEAAERARQLQQQQEQELQSKQSQQQPARHDWLFYVALVVGAALLAAALRAIGDLASAYWRTHRRGDGGGAAAAAEKKRQPTPYCDDPSSIYTLALPEQPPPPYTEKPSTTPSSCCKLPLQQSPFDNVV